MGKSGIEDWIRDRAGREPTGDEIDELWSQAADFGGYNASLTRLAHLRVMLNKLEEATEILYRRGWTIIRFDRRTLGTSDNPVSLIPAAGHPPGDGVGLYAAGQVLVPLDRKVALIMGTPGDPNALQLGSTALAHEINTATGRNPHQVVLHHPDDRPYDTVTLPPPRRTLTTAFEALSPAVFDNDAEGCGGDAGRG